MSHDDERFRGGLPDHHDPLTHFGGAPEALSALTLRLVLAAFGCIVLVAGSVAAIALHRTVFAAVLAVAACGAAVNVVVVARRKWRGEPG